MAKDPVRVLVTGAAGNNSYDVYFWPACPICSLFRFVDYLTCLQLDRPFSVDLLVGSLTYCSDLMRFKFILRRSVICLYLIGRCN